MSSPRIVSVTRTGNENDIIEPFVRHHAALVDLMLVCDDDSTDGTWTILEKLRDEGLPLLLFRASEVDWLQTEFTTRLMFLAFETHGADWVAALDADEFVEAPAGARLADVLPLRDDLLAQIRWNNFAWHRTISEEERNPVVRMKMRMPPRIDSAKAIVPRAALCGDPQARLLNGNHGLLRNGERCGVQYYEQLPLCHYPIRSINQFISKTVINHLRYTSLPNNHRPEIGFQYRKPFDLAKGAFEQLLPGIMEEMEQASPIYALQAGGKMIGCVEERALDYRGGPLLYSIYPTSALTNIVNIGERFARRIAELEEQLGLPSGL